MNSMELECFSSKKTHQISLQIYLSLYSISGMKKQSLKGKDLQENPQITLRNQLNNSRTKMQFSFSQSDRFQSVKPSISPPKFYDLPDLWTPKRRSMGYGKKVDFTKQTLVTPAPGAYSVKSAFDKNKNQGITMSQGREQIKKGNMFNIKSDQVPTPTTYNPSVNYNTRNYSIAKKISALQNKWVRQVPGPGNYSYLELTNERNKKIVSKYGSAPSMRFGKSQRPTIAKSTNSPGPGEHNITSPNFDESLYDKPYSSKFGTGKRGQSQQRGLSMPGPGTYQVFSQFLH